LKNKNGVEQQEFLGGAIGLSLLFHVPLFAGMAVTAKTVRLDKHARDAAISAIHRKPNICTKI
jgi:Mn2+/Fe2+ NRAMP family transporter